VAVMLHLVAIVVMIDIGTELVIEIETKIVIIIIIDVVAVVVVEVWSGHDIHAIEHQDLIVIVPLLCMIEMIDIDHIVLAIIAIDIRVIETVIIISDVNARERMHVIDHTINHQQYRMWKAIKVKILNDLVDNVVIVHRLIPTRTEMLLQWKNN
jgi:hypothetical protein